MQDFENFISAARIIFSGNIPYGHVPFFAPLWSSILIFPFAIIPKPLSNCLWQFASIVAVAAACMVTIPKSRFFPLLIIFSPPSLHTLIAGQLSAFVAIASTVLLVEVANRRRLWILLICSFIALSKPHLAAFPIAVMLFALIRKKEYQKMLFFASFFVFLVLLSELLIPTSTYQWLKAMLSGNYRTGDPSSLQHVLLTNGTMISIGVGYFQGPFLFFIPMFILYLYYFFKESLTPRVIALTLSIMFLALPYYRLYDFLMLIYPIGILCKEISGGFKKYKIESELPKIVDLQKSYASVGH